MAKLLVVDDSWLIRQTLTKYLVRAGHEVIIAENGRQGIEKCLSEKPACMLLDLLMPDMGGLEVLQELKGRQCTVPVIILTADIQATTQAKCTEAGAADFLQKPPNEENLIYRIGLVLKGRG